MNPNLHNRFRRESSLILLFGGAFSLPFADHTRPEASETAAQLEAYSRDLVTLRHDCRRAMAVENCAQCRLFPCAMADF